MERVEELKRLLSQEAKIVITTHQNPDGDAIGSVMALSLLLKSMGHQVHPIIPNEFPDFLKWMPGSETIIDFTRSRHRSERFIAEAEIIFYLDHNDARRGADMKDTLAASKARRIMIDHHPSPQLAVDFMLSRTAASSTCELIYEFIELMDKTNLLTPQIAQCIYTGIMTDTGCFNYSSSRPRTFEIVAHLLQFDIPKDEIFRNVYDSFTESRMRLLGYCLSEKMQVIPELGTAFISLSLEEQERFHFMTGDSEGFVNFPLSIKGINFTALFTERKDKIKISFRSRGSFPVNSFAEQHFSGGGHVNAAGGESTLSLQETINKFIDLLPQYLNGSRK